jgi:Transposase DDE domain
MKIRKVKSTDILIPLSLSLVRYRVYFHLPYRQTEGIIKATGMNIPNHPNSYGQICRRLSRLDIDNSSKIEDDDSDIVIAIESTGIKVTNRVNG